MPVTATMVLQTRVDLYAHNAIARVACLAHTHSASWGGSFTVSFGRAASIADFTGIDCCADCPVPLESCRTFARGGAIRIEKTVGTGMACSIAVVLSNLTVTFHAPPANVTLAGAVTRQSLVASPVNTRTRLVAMDAVLALHAGLAGRPVEALTTLTCARAVHPVQADPVSKAGVLGLPRAGLALGAKEARTAFSCNDSPHTVWLAPNEYGSLAHEIHGINTFPHLFT